MTDFNYQGVPIEAIPAIGTNARKMLDLYQTGEEVQEQSLCDIFGRNYRSILQRLRGDDFLHWRFISIEVKGVIEARMLDSRHVSGDRYQDALARAERKKELKSESHQEAMLGASRVVSAYEALVDATQKLVELEKPTKETNQ